jgi:hypothetical protein
MARTLPSPKVQIGWSTTTTGGFTIGTSTISGAHVLTGKFGPSGFTFTDVTSEVKRASGRRGRSDSLSRMNEGACQLVLKDTTGKYNPNNAGSSLAGLLRPGRPIRVTDTHLGIEYGLFYGIIRTIESHPARDEREAVLDCVDLFDWLRASNPVIAATGPTTVGAAIGLVLDAIDFDGGSARALDTGSAVADFSAVGDTSALGLIEGLLAADLGVFFVDGDGVATYHDRDRRFQSGASVATLSGSAMSRIYPRVSLDQIKNRARVTREGGAEQEANDATSQGIYGVRDHPPLTTPYLATDQEAANLASFLVALQKDPNDPARELEVPNRDDTAITLQLGLELNDRVTVTETLSGTSFAGNIEGIAWEKWGGAKFHRTAFTVGKRTLGDFFVIGSSAIGSAEVIGY